MRLRRPFLLEHDPRGPLSERATIATKYALMGFACTVILLALVGALL